MKILDKLEHALGLMHDQSRYAEGKNVALVVFTSAIAVGLISNIDNLKKIIQFKTPLIVLPYDENSFTVAVFALVVCLVASMTISLISFLPQIRQRGLENPSGENLLFFDSNCRFQSSTDLLGYYSSKYEHRTAYELDVSNQILNLSLIAARKYRYFKIALYPVILSPLVVVLGAIVGHSQKL